MHRGQRKVGILLWIRKNWHFDKKFGKSEIMCIDIADLIPLKPGRNVWRSKICGKCFSLNERVEKTTQSWGLKPLLNLIFLVWMFYQGKGREFWKMVHVATMDLLVELRFFIVNSYNSLLKCYDVFTWTWWLFRGQKSISYSIKHTYLLTLSQLYFPAVFVLNSNNKNKNII